MTREQQLKHLGERCKLNAMLCYRPSCMPDADYGHGCLMARCVVRLQHVQQTPLSFKHCTGQFVAHTSSTSTVPPVAQGSKPGVLRDTC
jgi:hypothetical protein